MVWKHKHTNTPRHTIATQTLTLQAVKSYSCDYGRGSWPVEDHVCWSTANTQFRSTWPRSSQDGTKVQGTRPPHEIRLQHEYQMAWVWNIWPSRGHPPSCQMLHTQAIWYSLTVALVVAQQQAACHIAMQGAKNWCTQSLNQPVEERQTSLDENCAIQE